MAITAKNTGQYSTVLTDSTTHTVVRVSSMTDEKRVTSVTVSVVVGSSDSNTFTDNQKAAVHSAMVSAVQAKIGSGF